MITKNQSGFGKIKLIIVLTVVSLSGYLGWQTFNFYFCYWDLEELMLRQAKKAAVFSDEEIRTNILKRIKESNIPYYPEDDPDGEQLSIVRDDKIYIDLRYTEVLAIDLGEDYYYELKEFPFHVHVEAELPGQ